MCKSLMTPVESMDAKPGIHEQQLRVSERKVMRKIQAQLKSRWELENEN